LDVKTANDARRLETVESAKLAGLRYVTDQTPGITRMKSGKGFVYKTADGKRVTDPDTLLRIRSLVIPPAWTDVCISPYANGLLQATGRDAKGRKQSRYHADFRAHRDSNKYERVIAFAKALPQIRARVARDIKRNDLSRECVLATVVSLLEKTLIRIGNDQYAKDNNHFGLTTMRDGHAKVKGSTIKFSFVGKSGIRHEVDVQDKRLAKIVSAAQDLPEQELFAYVDDKGNSRDVKSDDVNAYLREISGEDFTAKDFRTWAGTVLAAHALAEFESFDSQTQAKRNVVAAIERVSKMLGNTRAVCRKCYIHPAILDSYLDGSMAGVLQNRAELALKDVSKLKPEEVAAIALIRDRMKAEKSRRKAA
jgi:DNA topoisomerase I